MLDHLILTLYSHILKHICFKRAKHETFKLDESKPIVYITCLQ